MLEQLRATEQRLSALHAATTGVQRTVVMPAAIDHSLTSAQTQVLAAHGSATAATVVAPALGTGHGSANNFAGPPTDSADTNLLGARGSSNSPTDRLSDSAQKRRKRGFWLIGIVVILALIAGGVGLYFSVGPGGKVAIPDVAGQPQATAQQSIETLGLKVALEEINDLEVPVGNAVKTDPTTGSEVPKDSQVTLFISKGPAIISLPQLIGAHESDAEAAIASAGLVLGTTDRIYRDADAGTVLDALNTDGVSLAVDGSTEGVEYPQGQTVTLIVSAGGIPDVSGLSVDAATAALKAVGLGAASGEQVYSDNVPTGDVVSASAAGETVRPGETIHLQISRGPEPVAVPDVVGKSWLDAKSLLENAGFKLSYPAGADIVPALVTVTAVNPKAGTMLPKGSSVTVSVSF
jgi:beta-lactam-binding protein with PASTA domain